MATKFYRTKHREEQLKKLNASARRKIKRLDSLYGVKHDREFKYMKDFKSGDDYKSYIKDLKKFTDYNTERYIKLDSGDVIKYSDYRKLKKATDRRNKENYKRIKQRVAWINEKTDKKLNAKEIFENPIIADDHKLGDFAKKTISPELIKEQYTSGSSVKRATEKAEEIAKPSYLKGREETIKSNFLRAIKEDWGHIPEHQILYDHIQQMDNKQFALGYYYLYENPFEFVYSTGDYLKRFLNTCYKFGLDVDVEDYG